MDMNDMKRRRVAPSSSHARARRQSQRHPALSSLSSRTPRRSAPRRSAVWALAQRRQAQMTPAAAAESAEEMRAREAVRRLMDCPIIGILVRVFLFA